MGGQKRGKNSLGNRTLHRSRPTFTSFKKWKNKTCPPVEYFFTFTKLEEEGLIFNFVFCLFTQNSLQSDGTPPPCLLQCCFYNKRRYAPLTESSSQNFFKEVLYASAKTFSSAQLLLTNSKIYLIKSVTA